MVRKIVGILMLINAFGIVFGISVLLVGWAQSFMVWGVTLTFLGLLVGGVTLMFGRVE